MITAERWVPETGRNRDNIVPDPEIKGIRLTQRGLIIGFL
jgi:hypothetical protein